MNSSYPISWFSPIDNTISKSTLFPCFFPVYNFILCISIQIVYYLILLFPEFHQKITSWCTPYPGPFHASFCVFLHLNNIVAWGYSLFMVTAIQYLILSVCHYPFFLWAFGLVLISFILLIVLYGCSCGLLVYTCKNCSKVMFMCIFNFTFLWQTTLQSEGENLYSH